MYRVSPCKAVCKKVLHAYLQHKRKAFGYNKQAMIAITAKEGDGIVSAFLAEKTRTPPMKFLWWCFLCWSELMKGSLREGVGAVGD